MNSRESDDYLYHFTKKYDSLISIMTEKFKPFYCIEDLSFIYGVENELIAFPIICFCDIPYERHYYHRGKYGNYGIGLTKVWAKNNNLSIVSYTYKESLASASLRIMIKNYAQEMNIEIRNALSILLMSCKPYDGYSYDKTGNITSNTTIRLYDEKEWRYIPINVDGLCLSISLSDYENQIEFLNKIEKELPRIQVNNKLDFEVEDIKYIFLDSEKEKDKFISDIRNARIYSEQELFTIENLITFNE